MNWSFTVQIPDTFTFGFKDKTVPKLTFHSKGMAAATINRAICLGLGSMLRDCFAGIKTTKGKIDAANAKWAAMLTGDFGRTPQSRESRILNVGLKTVRTAWLKKGTTDAWDLVLKDAMAQPDPITHTVKALCAMRGDPVAKVAPTVKVVMADAIATVDKPEIEI